MRRRNDASGIPRPLQLLCPMLAVPPPAALPAARIGVEPGRDDEVAIGLLRRRCDGDRRRRRALFAAHQPPLPSPARALLLAGPLLLTGPRPRHRVLAPEDHARARADPEAKPENRRDRRAGQVVRPRELAEHDAHHDADRPAHDHRALQRLAIALGGLAPAVPARALEHLLAALGGAHRRHALGSPRRGQPRRTTEGPENRCNPRPCGQRRAAAGTVPTIQVLRLPAPSTAPTSDRARLLTPRRVAIVGAAWIVTFAVLVLALPAAGWPARVLVNGVYLIPIVISEALIIRAARKVPSPRRRFWILMAIAGPLTLAGEVVVSWHHLVIGDEPPPPGLPDVFFISYYVVLLAALVFGLRPARQLQSWRAALDASIVAAVVAFVSYDLLIPPQLSSGVTSTQLVGLAYPTMDVAMLVALISLALASFGHIPWSLRLVALGIVTATMGDDALTYLSIHSVNVEVGRLKIAWTTTSVLYGAAAWQACREPAEVRQQSGRGRGAGLALVAAGVALTVCTVVADLIIEGGLHLEAAILVLYVFAAVLVRLWVAAREREALARAGRFPAAPTVHGQHRRAHQPGQPAARRCHPRRARSLRRPRPPARRARRRPRLLQRSTTATAIRPATRCSSTSRAACAVRSGRAISSRATAARSSSSS